jgi:hypothetical protein
MEYLGEFESIFETALDHESGYKLGTVTFGEITFRQKNLTLPSLYDKIGNYQF